MGNYRFKLSDLMPNSWLYKLREMSKTRKNQHKIPNRKQSSSISAGAAVAEPKPHQRKSYYFSRDLTKTTTSDQNLPVEPPRKSSRIRRRRSTKRNRLVSSSVSAGCSCRASLESVWTTKPPEDYSNSLLSRTSTSDDDSVLPEYGSDRGLTTPETFDGMVSWSTSCKCSVDNDMEITNGNDKRPFHKGFDIVSEEDRRLPPIITSKEDPTKIQITSAAEFSEENAYGSLSVKVVKEDILTYDHQLKKNTSSHPIRRYSPHSPSHGVKLRTNSPRIANRRISVGRKSVSSNSSSGCVGESFAVMKSSKDPGRDFRESMEEMIVENNIRASSDLEELLACYLSLNSSEYHDLIINVFKQIWFDFLHK